MSNYSPEEKEFINGIWNKVRYIEQVRIEDETIKRNKKNIRKKQIKSMLISFTAGIILLSPLIVDKSFTRNALPYVGLVLLGCGILYEHILHSKFMEV